MARDLPSTLCAMLVALVLTGCDDPKACGSDADCPGEQRCDLDERECVDPSGGGGEGGDLCTASQEACDGVDNDCDGQIDEAAALAERGVIGATCGDADDLCSAGVVACEGGALVCAPTASPADELCNGVDDDCDGEVDEDFTLGGRCGSGSRDCFQEGVFVCAADGGGVVCGAEAVAPTDESCDGIDNDCDGEVDEDIDLGERCDEGLGECLRIGLTVCLPTGEVGCSATAGPPAQRDLCNSRDEDCDGIVDEDYDIGAPCWVGLGECEAEGIVRCTPDSSAACDARPGRARVELCDRLDDDCDGVTDEDFQTGDACSDGTGRCRGEGFWVCEESGVGERCTAKAKDLVAEEDCNELDDDCDGAVDEDFDIGADCGLGVGTCRREGQRICGDGPFTICPVVPGRPREDERCDGEDDDCDAQTDEDFDLGGFCRVGQGGCVEVGELICSGDLRGVRCDAQASDPVEETCNDIDDDCDGVTDEPRAELPIDLPGPAQGTLLLPHDDGGGVVVTLAGGELSTVSFDCAWSVDWRVDLPDGDGAASTPHRIVDGPDGGVVVLEGAEDRSLLLVDAEGERWRVELGAEAEVGGMAATSRGYAVAVGDHVQFYDGSGQPAGQWAHGVGSAPALAPGPGGSLLLSWTQAESGNGVVRRMTPAGAQVWTRVLDGGGASLSPVVQAIGEAGSVLLTGRLRDGENVAAWIGVLSAAGVVQVDRGSPFYDGCIGAAFAPDASQPVLRCEGPGRLIFLAQNGDVRRAIDGSPAAISADPFAAESVVLVAEVEDPGLVVRRVLVPE